MDPALQKEIVDIAKTLIERLTSAPAVVLVLILLFRKRLEAVLKSVSDPISRVVESLLSRNFKFGLNKEGLKLEAEVQMAVAAQGELPAHKATGLAVMEPKELPPPRTEGKTEVKVDDSQAQRLQELRNVYMPPIALEQAELIRKDLNNFKLDQSDQVGILVNQLALTQLRVRAEYTYRTIFGSQIALLKFLNTSGGGTRARLLEFYETAKTQFPNLYETYSFEEYLNYLMSQGLVVAHPPDRYIITVAGREFLKWMTEASVLENKAF